MKTLAALGVPTISLRWIQSFLMDHQQSVKIDDTFSDMVSPNGGMPHGTYVGSYVFLSPLDDLKSLFERHTFVNVCTLTKSVKELNTSRMQQEIDDLYSWSNLNHMNINIKKTKEMLFESIIKNPSLPLQLNGQPIERVSSYKFLDFHVTDTLKWNEHVLS